MPAWIIAGVIGMCIVLAIFACWKHRMKVNKAEQYSTRITSNSDGDAQMVRMPESEANHMPGEAVMHLNAQPGPGSISEREPVHVLTEDVMYLDIQPGHANVNKQQIKKHDRDITTLTEWLTNSVKLPQYVSNFADNGYETVQSVCDISTVENLAEIGVTLVGHQTRILAQVKKLKARPEEKEQEQNVLDGYELEGEAAPPILEGSPPELNADDHDVVDIQGG
eukprot:307607_1